MEVQNRRYNKNIIYVTYVVENFLYLEYIVVVKGVSNKFFFYFFLCLIEGKVIAKVSSS